MVDEGRHTRHWGVPGVPEKKDICNLYIKDGYFRYYPNCYPFPLKKKNIFTKILKPPSHGIHQWFLQVHLLPFSAPEASLGQVYLESQLCGRFDLCHCLQWPTGRVQLSAPWEKVWERTVLLCLQPGKCRGRKIWNMHRVRKKLHRLPCTLW